LKKKDNIKVKRYNEIKNKALKLMKERKNIIEDNTIIKNFR